MLVGLFSSSFLLTSTLFVIVLIYGEKMYANLDIVCITCRKWSVMQCIGLLGTAARIQSWRGSSTRAVPPGLARRLASKVSTHFHNIWPLPDRSVHFRLQPRCFGCLSFPSILSYNSFTRGKLVRCFSMSVALCRSCAAERMFFMGITSHESNPLVPLGLSHHPGHHDRHARAAVLLRTFHNFTRSFDSLCSTSPWKWCQ